MAARALAVTLSDGQSGRGGRGNTIAMVVLLHAAALWMLAAHDSRPLARQPRMVYMDARYLNGAVRPDKAADVIAASVSTTARHAPPREPLPAARSATATATAGSLPPDVEKAEKAEKAAQAAEAAGKQAAAEKPSAPASASEHADGADQPLSAAPRPLDIDAMRKLARDDERRRVPTPLQRVRDAQRLRAAGDTDTARAIAQSARPDCRKASGESTSVNLFTLIPLAYATLTDTGCKW